MSETPIEFNVHGFPKTKGFNNYNEWQTYAIQKLNLVNDRIKISDFLKRDQFLKTNRDFKGTEQKNVIDFKKDPYPKTQVKKSSDYISTQYQRREFGFREKIIQGYPDFLPDRIGFGDTRSKVIAGFVTVGDGVFSGIPPHDDTPFDKKETRRQSEYGYGRVVGKKLTPNGLCFIQDETAAIGIHVGSDVRFMWHPKLFSNFLSNSTVSVDSMHTGASLIPRSDYRQFLKVGDFVIIETGIKLKYWNSLLGGNQTHQWETLFGYGEVYDTFPFIDVYVGGQNYPTRIDKLNAVDPINYPYNPPIDSNGMSLHKKTMEAPPEDFIIHEDNPSDYGTRNVIDHAWSTGTPIPVNSGMPYVMTEEFLVDSTDRRSPHPKMITTKEMRDLDGNGKNPGSKLKGQLVKLKNLEIVSPCKRWSIGVDLATDKNGNILEPGLYSTETELTAPVLERKSEAPTYKGLGYPQPVNSKINNLPNKPTPEHLYFTNESHDVWIPKGINMIFDFPSEVVRKIFPETNPSEIYSRDLIFVGQFTNREITGSDDYFNTSQQTNPSLPKHFKGDYKYWKHKFIEHFGSDVTNQRIEMWKYSRRSGPEGYPNGNEWSTAPITDSEIESFINAGGRRFDTLGSYNYEGWSIPSDSSATMFPKVPWGARYQFRKEGDRPGTTWYNFSQVLFGLTDGAGSSDFFDQFEGGLDRVVENSWPDLLPNYKRMGMPYYKYIEVVQPFPISIDIEDGGYWFTEPNVKLASGNRTVGDLSRGDMSDRRHVQAHSTFINRYENYKREYVNKTPMDGCFTTYSSQIKLNKTLQTEKVQLLANKVYYATDENGIVIPIRINANTEIARFRIPVPVGKFDITGILWQYSTGKPGTEWNREGYMMQIWPRFASDIVPSDLVETKKDGPPPPPPPPPPPVPPTPPTRLPDITINVGDAIPISNINSLNCDTLKFIIDGNNQFIKRMNLSEPLQGCDGLQPGQEMYVIVESDGWYGLTRTFYFRKDKDGNCTCLLVPKGTNLQASRNL